MMAQTSSYDEMILKRMAKDRKFAAEVFKGAIVALFEGDYHYGLTSLRDIVKVGMGFQALSQAVGISTQNLHRTLSTRGNPTIKTLGRIVAAISDFNGFRAPSLAVAS